MPRENQEKSSDSTANSSSTRVQPLLQGILLGEVVNKKYIVWFKKIYVLILINKW